MFVIDKLLSAWLAAVFVLIEKLKIILRDPILLNFRCRSG
jgi:hypothetical protein